MKKFFLFTLLVVAPSFASAGDINYAFINGVRADKEVHINYRGPSIDKHFVCDVKDISCKQFNPDKKPFLVTDKIPGISFTVSPDGVYAVATVGFGPSRVFRLFSIEKGLRFLEDIPIDSGIAVSRVIISRDSSKILFRNSERLFVYDIKSRKVSDIKVSNSGLTFFLLSPSGNFVSGYDAQAKKHRIISLRSGKETELRSKVEGYFEISGDDKWGAYVDESRGIHELMIADMADFPRVSSRDVRGGGLMVADFTFHKNLLYFITNKTTPFTWSLFKYDPSKKDIETIDESVSYSDFMRQVGEYLLYYSVDGKNLYVSLYNHESKKKNRFSSVKSSDAERKIKREEAEFGGVSSVLVTGDRVSKRNKAPLVVWLHGGPRRQTSVGYHPYLSYAVYDELLERLAIAGARVLKLDYTGSWGYGEDFMSDLKGGVGVKDVGDVHDAIEEFTDEYKTSEVYLIGNSYGGYLGMKSLVESPKTIDGVVSINGVFDWRSLAARIPSTPFTVHFGGVPNAVTARAYERADITNKLSGVSDDVPILVVYGKKDSTVPVWQSQEFFAIAEVLDKNAGLVVYEDEEHILRNRKTLNDLCRRVTETFDLKSSVCR